MLQQLDQPPPPGFARWNGALLATALKDISDDQIWRVLRKHGISLERRRSWCLSTDPCFAQKAADVVGLYLHPPENALVLSIDEKPHIQALERAQGWLKLPNGKALTGVQHDYKRHGTTTLFAALEVATGLVKANHYQRRRRVEFLDFMNAIVREHAGRELHVILDNLNTHKPKHDRWLARHKNVRFHFTPTHASWLNQVEIWFSILQQQSLAGASFTVRASYGSTWTTSCVPTIRPPIPSNGKSKPYSRNILKQHTLTYASRYSGTPLSNIRVSRSVPSHSSRQLTPISV